MHVRIYMPLVTGAWQATATKGATAAPRGLEVAAAPMTTQVPAALAAPTSCLSHGSHASEGMSICKLDHVLPDCGTQIDGYIYITMYITMYIIIIIIIIIMMMMMNIYLYIITRIYLIAIQKSEIQKLCKFRSSLLFWWLAAWEKEDFINHHGPSVLTQTFCHP